MKPHGLIFIVLGQYFIHLYNGLSKNVLRAVAVFSLAR